MIGIRIDSVINTGHHVLLRQDLGADALAQICQLFVETLTNIQELPFSLSVCVVILRFAYRSAVFLFHSSGL